MSIHRAFQLGYFPNGSSFFSLNDVPLTNEALVLWYYTFEDGINLGTTVCGYLVPNEELLGQHYFQSPPREDGSSFSVYFYDGNFHIPDMVDTFDFSYFSGFGETFSFSVHSSAMRFVVGDCDGSGDGTQTPSNGVFLESLNGADGSFADGTPVTVIGRDGAYKVLASRNYYNDAKEKQNMLFYLLERTDLAHKPTMLVADVHVQKVA